MRKIIREAWRAQIVSEMQRRFPAFHQRERKAPGEWPRMLKFVHDHSAHLQHGIVFRPLDEAFDAYAGWSKIGRLPFSRLAQVNAEAMLTEFGGESTLLPVSVIAQRSGAAFWNFWTPDDAWLDDPARFAAEFTRFYTRDVSAAEAHELVRGPIDAAMTEIERCVMPWLARVAVALA